MNRRKFLQNMAMFSGAALVAGSGIIYSMDVAPYDLEVAQVRIPLPGLHPSLNGLRAAQISDLHMGLWISRAQLDHVVSLILEQEPDLVLLTGDFLTNGGDIERALADIEAVLGRLTQRAPVYAVLGNHDHTSRIARARLQNILTKLGIQLISNDILPYRRSEGVLYIAGLDSVMEGRSNLKAVLEKATPGGPTLLLVHEPDIADQAAETGKFSVQFSGHSHGGQVNLPFVGRLVLPSMGRKYPAGLYHVKNMLLYTNRGIGMFHLRVRINCPPEITMFTFVSAEG